LVQQILSIEKRTNTRESLSDPEKALQYQGYWVLGKYEGGGKLFPQSGINNGHRQTVGIILSIETLAHSVFGTG